MLDVVLPRESLTGRGKGWEDNNELKQFLSVFDKAISSSEAAYWQLKLMDSALYMDISVLNRKYDKEE